MIPAPAEPKPAAPLASRLNRTFGPIGLLIGLPVGATTGWWMASALGVEKKNRKWFSLAAAVYCTIPFTEIIPLATLTGAYVRFTQSGRPAVAEQPAEIE